MVTERDKAGNRLGPEGFKQMTNQQGSDQILVVEMGDDPQFTDKLNNLTLRLERNPSLDVVLDMREVNQIYSSNISQLLRVRAAVIANKRRLFLAETRTQVWGVLLESSLDKKFDVADDVATALTSLEMNHK
jgi:anti-anti-sigma regulatory factor